MSSDRYNFKDNLRMGTNGKVVYTSVLYPEIPVSDNDIYIIAKETDRLDTLAYKYYGDVTKWWIIAHANHIVGSFYIPNDTQIRIPMSIESIANDLETLNKSK